MAYVLDTVVDLCKQLDLTVLDSIQTHSSFDGSAWLEPSVKSKVSSFFKINGPNNLSRQDM